MNNFITTENNVNYPYIRSLRALLATTIVTRDEYVQWVGNWKIMHADLVRAIHHQRSLKNQAKKDHSKLKHPNHYWGTKKALGAYAREMYKARNENKASLKAGTYKEVEVA